MPRRLVNFALALTIGGAIALGVAVFIVVPPLMVGSSTFTGQEGVSPAGAKEKLLKARSDIRTSGIALLTFFGVVAGAVLTFRTVRATRAGQAADRLTDAVKALGDTSQASQMSALYALGSIARRADSDYHLAIKLLAHVLRDRAGPWPPTGQATDVTGARVVPETVDAAVTMLGRRRARPSDIRAIDLSGVDLRNVEFSRGSFSYLNLARSNFAGAFLAAANLRHSLLAGAYVDGADLRRADLRHADLTGVDLRRALIEGADLRGATQMRVRFPEPLPADRGVKKA